VTKEIVLIRGDGIGPEVIEQAKNILDITAASYGHCFRIKEAAVGGCAVDEYGEPLPEDSLTACMKADAVLLGAVGGSKWNDAARDKRPESGLLKLRKAMALYCNMRPVRLEPHLRGMSPLKGSAIGGGVDMVIVRELTGGLYFGRHETVRTTNGIEAKDELTYTEHEIRRIGEKAFEMAMTRRKKLTSVDKANVLDSSKLWRKIMHELAEKYHQVEYEDMYVDNAAMQLMRAPSQFDVIVTENMFGDILSDEAGMISGSIGMLPSMSFGEGRRSLYEPAHGSAPDIAGKDMANPLAAIFSAALMLRCSFGLEEEAANIERAVSEVIAEGYRTPDICRPGEKRVGCCEMGALVARRL